MEGNNNRQGKFSPVRIIVFGFLFLIVAGAILLWLPISSAEGVFTSPIDALFTSTTSVCVTGLTTVTTASHWSLFGKIVILILIQLGGLGVVCAGIGVMIVIKKKITMRERLLIQTAYNLENIDGMVRLIKNVTMGAFTVELIGAVFYGIVFIPDYGFIKGIWYSIFHSVSAFCNAGIDLIGDSSLSVYRYNPVINITTMLLIIVGGIGFIVWWDIKKVVLESIRKKRMRGQLFKRLSVHSKVAVVTTVILIFGGAFIILISEYNNPDTIKDMSTGSKIMASLFESVTVRTAGFFTIPQGNFRDTSYIIILILMLIGGSPMGTAGGLKTTTAAMMFLCVRSTVKGHKGTEAFNRRISSDSVRTAISVLAIVAAIIIGAVFILSVIEPFGLRDICFEVVSAMGTVGLTTGVTGSFSMAGKFILCMVMFAGRIGPITLAMAFNMRRGKRKKENMRDLAEGRIIIG